MSISTLSGTAASSAPAVSTATRLAEDVSVRIRVLAIVASFLVVIRHSPTVDVQQISVLVAPKIAWGVPGDFGMFLTTVVQQFITGQIAALGVAIFLCTSGYLFFRTTLQGAVGDWYSTKVRKRVRTILIPYLIFSLSSLAIVAFLQQFDGVRGHFRSGLVSEMSLSEWLLRFLVHPYAYPLWYLRDLMIYAVLSPIVYVAVRFAPVGSLSVMFAAWLAFPESPVRLDGPLFFALGAAIALRGWSLPKELPHERAWLILALWLCLCALSTALSFVVPQTALMVAKATTVVGGAAVWMCYRQLLGGLEQRLIPIAACSFFLFVGHEPLLKAVKRLGIALVGDTPLGLTLTFVAAPILVIVLVCSLALLLRRRAPALYSLLTGRE